MTRENGETVKPPAFSNGSEYSMWAYNYCQQCWYDRAINRDGDYSKGCEWHALMLMHEPVEVLVYTDANPIGVHCLKFTPDDGGKDEGIPTPPPQIDGQLSMDDLAPIIGSGNES